MAHAWIADGTMAEGSTSVAPACNTALTEVGDILLLLAWSGQSSAASPAAPGGWALESNISGGGGAWGQDAGPRRVTAWVKLADASDVSGATHTVTLAAGTGNEVLSAQIVTVRSDLFTEFSAHEINVAATAGSDSVSNTSWVTSQNGAFHPTGALVVPISVSVPDDGIMSFPAYTADGGVVTYGTVSQRETNANLNGFDLRAHYHTVPVVSGAEVTVNGEFTATLSSAATGTSLALSVVELVSAAIPGPTATITLTSPAGGATGHVEGPTASITFTAPAGGTAGHAGGPTASVTLTAPAGNVTGHAKGVTATVTLTAPVGGPAGMGWFFYPPTVLEAPLALDRKLPLSRAGLFERYKIARGISVLVEDGAYIEGRWFDFNRINDVLAEGGKYYDGGHRHGPIPDPERTDLIAAGYEDNLLFEQITFGKVS